MYTINELFTQVRRIQTYKDAMVRYSDNMRSSCYRGRHDVDEQGLRRAYSTALALNGGHVPSSYSVSPSNRNFFELLDVNQFYAIRALSLPQGAYDGENHTYESSVKSLVHDTLHRASMPLALSNYFSVAIINTTRCGISHETLLAELKQETDEYGYVTQSLDYAASMAITTPYHRINIVRVENQIIVLTNTMSNAFICNLIAVLFRFLNEPEQGTPEYAILEALVERDLNKVKDTLVQLQEKALEALRAKLVEELPSSVVSTFKVDIDTAIANARRSEVDLRDTVQNALRSYKDCLLSLERATKNLRILNLGKDDADTVLNAFANYLQSDYGNRLKAYYPYDRYFYVLLRTELLFFDPTLVQEYFDNERSFLRDYGSLTKTIINAIFLQNKYRLIFHTAVCLCNNDSPKGLQISRVEQLQKFAPSEYLENTHIAEYDCWGSNAQAIVDACCNKNYEAMYEQMIAMLSSINTGDVTVLRRLIDRINDLPGTAEVFINNETNEIISKKKLLEELENAKTNNSEQEVIG